MRILVVESDYIARYQMEEILVKWGHDIVSCCDYESAWQIVKQGYQPCLVIMEWKRSQMEGIRICQEVRRLVTSHYVYILLLTMEKNLSDRLLGIEAGADNYLDRPFNLIELRSQLEVVGRIVGSQSKLLDSLEHNQANMVRDALTGLWSQGEIIDILYRETDRACREKSFITAVMVGLDNFKGIDNQQSREVKNEVLRKVARRMSSSLRQYDSLGRYGGEEFLVVLPGCQENSIISVAEKILTVISEEIKGSKKETAVVSVTASVGVAINKNPGEKDAKLLIQAADSALLEARENSHNRVKITSL